MTPFRPLFAGLALCLTQFAGSAQPDTVKIKDKALLFADSLIRADHHEFWDVYVGLVPASVLKYHGGKDGYIEHVKTARPRTISDIEEDLPQLKIIQLMTENDLWECVIRESRYIHKDDKKLHVTTYFVGESKDEGETWRLFDVGYNKVANIIYMMPEVFGDLPIPEHTILTEEEEIAKAKPVFIPAGTTNKKAPDKKK